MSDKPKSGREQVREALRIANKKVSLASVARDLGCTVEQIQGFAEGRVAVLPDDLMHKIVARHWANGGKRYDAERDLLVSVERPSQVGAPRGAPGPFKHPDPRVARAYQSYLDALKDAG